MIPGDDQAREQVLEQTQGVLSRSVVLMAAKIATWSLALVMTILLPRMLGPAGFGQLYFAISFTAVFSIMVEFGLNSLVAREVSRKRQDATRYLLNAAMIKGGLWAIAFSIMLVVIRLVGYPPTTRAAVLILAVGVLFSSMATLLVAVLQANDRIRWVAASAVFEKAVYVVLGVTVLLLGYGVVAVALVLLVGSISGFLLDLWWLRRLAANVPLHDGWQGIEVGDLVKRALPFFSVLFFGAVYFRVDVVIMSLLKSDVVVGWYGVAYRLFETTNFLPEAFLFAFFPVFCRLSKQDDNALVLAAQKSVDLLMLAGIPIAVGVFLLSDEIITTLYGPVEYAASIIVLRVLSLAIVLMYANGAFMQLLIATERQHKLVITAGVAAALNVGLNLVLIRSMGATGAAVATVATEAVVLSMNFTFLPRELTRELRLSTPLKALAAATVMAVPLIALNGQNLFLLIAIGVVVYFLAIMLLKGLPADDWAMVKAAILDLRTA